MERRQWLTIFICSHLEQSNQERSGYAMQVLLHNPPELQALARAALGRIHYTITENVPEARAQN